MLVKEWYDKSTTSLYGRVTFICFSNHGGIRNALVVAIGITAIGAVGAGGLGDIIIRGTNATDGASIILVGALPTAFMAIITDWVLGIIERRLDPASKHSN